MRRGRSRSPPRQALADWRNGAKLSEPVSVLATGFSYYTPATQRLLPIDGLQQDISDAVRSAC